MRKWIIGIILAVLAATGAATGIYAVASASGGRGAPAAAHSPARLAARYLSDRQVCQEIMAANPQQSAAQTEADIYSWIAQLGPSSILRKDLRNLAHAGNSGNALRNQGAIVAVGDRCYAIEHP